MLKSISDSRDGGLDLSKPSGLIGDTDFTITIDTEDWDAKCEYTKAEKEFRNKVSNYRDNVSPYFCFILFMKILKIVQ